MSPAVEMAPASARIRALMVTRPRIAWDALAVCALAAIWATLLPFRYEALPLQLWDESRNANNALEMALHGFRLGPTYAGVVDHWNTKPPLLIWMQAALLRAGAAPLVALRLPSWLAAAATAAMLWAVPRYALKDRPAGMVSAVLLFGSGLYLGPHAARTGDYDALESAFVLAYTLAVWKALEDGRARWLLLAGGLMAFGVLTKGVAALLPAPGLAIYALTRRRRAVTLAKAPAAWGAAALFCLMVGGYYVARERVDPGYLTTVAANELGGRFLRVAENHRGDVGFYFGLLVRGAEPCAVFSVLAALTLTSPDGPRRRLALATGLATASLLAVLSVSRSKLQWYAVPAIPLLSLLGGLGLSDSLRGLRPTGAVRRIAASAAIAALALGLVNAVLQSQACPQHCPAGMGGPRLRQGEFLHAVRRLDPPRPVTVLDGGFYNDAGFAAYDPMLKFYADLEGARGLAVRVVHGLGRWAPGERVGGCGAAAASALRRDPRLAPILSVDGCTLFRAASDRPAAR